MSERKERCETCRFRHDRPADSDSYERRECRRNAPVIVEAMLGEASLHSDSDDQGFVERQARVFPIVFDDDWCGEWQPTINEKEQ